MSDLIIIWIHGVKIRNFFDDDEEHLGRIIRGSLFS
jgi:hypothetical protein